MQSEYWLRAHRFHRTVPPPTRTTCTRANVEKTPAFREEGGKRKAHLGSWLKPKGLEPKWHIDTLSQ